MPSNIQTSSTFQSSSYSSHSDSTGHRYTETIASDPSGTTVRRTTQEAGQPAVEETNTYPSGRQVQTGHVDDDRRIEDVTDDAAAKQYEERMEDEYAKREGGA